MDSSNNQVLSVEDIPFKEGMFIILSSKRCSGKSVLVRHIVKHLLDLFEYSAIILFSETSDLNEDYSFIDKSLIFKTSQLEEKIKKIMDIQLKNKKKNKKVNLLLILDDVHLTEKSKELSNVSSLGRHYNITTLMSIQFNKHLCNNIIKNNLDMIFISDLGDVCLKSIYESIHINMSYKEFKNYVNENNHSFQFIMYNSRINEKNKKLSIVKARLFNNLKLQK